MLLFLSSNNVEGDKASLVIILIVVAVTGAITWIVTRNKS